MLIYTIIWLPILLLGYVLIPIALLSHAYEIRKSYYWPEKEIIVWTWPIMYPWGNEEDGILAGEEYLDKPEWFRILYWSAHRNPTNNLRFIRPFGLKPQPEKVRFKLCLNNRFKFCINEKSGIYSEEWLAEAEEGRIEPEFSYWAWQGLYPNYRKEFRMPFTVKIPFTSLGYNKGDMIRFWIGFKVYPSSMYKIPEYQKFGISFGHQFKRLK